MILTQIIALAEKEIKLGLRFKGNFFLEFMVKPTFYFIWFWLIYSGFFKSGTTGIGELNQSNFVPYLLLGTLANTYFSTGTLAFTYKFIYEKYWKTIQAILSAPMNRLVLVLGMGLAQTVRLLVPSALFLSAAYVLQPTPFFNLLLVLAVFSLIFLIFLGLGLIQGAFAISDENYIPVIEYLKYAVMFLSCFYYPIDIMPSFIKPLVLINPVYHGMNLVRALWFNEGISTFSVVWLLSFALFSPLIGVFIFNKIIRRLGIQGY